MTDPERRTIDRRCAANAPAFSLVELLVVISILALLVAILLPSLGRAKDQARLVEDASRIRQCAAIAVGMYPSDNSDAILPIATNVPGFPNTTPISGTGYMVMAPSADTYGTRPGMPASHQFNVMWPDLIQRYAQPQNQRHNAAFREYSSILYCSADTAWTPGFSTGWWIENTREFSWRMNYDVMPMYDPGLPGPWQVRTGRKLSSVRKPAQKVLLAETHYEAIWGVMFGFLTVDPPFGWGPNLLTAENRVWAPWLPQYFSPPRHKAAHVAANCDGSARVVPFAKNVEFVAPGPYVSPGSGATFGAGPNWDLDTP